MKNKTQWHPAFYAAMELELKEYAPYLHFHREYNINTKPVQIDLLIVRKANTSIKISNEIGEIFRGHNLIEYKSPEDSLNLDTFIKVIGYACLYKANESYVEEIKLEDITLSFVREYRPKKLIEWFLDNGYFVEEKHKGILYVSKRDNFPIQIIISSEVSKTSQKWITLLSSNLSEEDATRAVLQTKALSLKQDKDCADAVMQIAVSENPKVFNEIKREDELMCEALRKLMEPEINEAVEKAVEKAVEDTLDNSHRDIILHALKAGKTVNEIADFTGISLEKVKSVNETFISATV